MSTPSNKPFSFYRNWVPPASSFEEDKGKEGGIFAPVPNLFVQPLNLSIVSVQSGHPSSRDRILESEWMPYLEPVELLSSQKLKALQKQQRSGEMATFAVWFIIEPGIPIEVKEIHNV